MWLEGERSEPSRVFSGQSKIAERSDALILRIIKDIYIKKHLGLQKFKLKDYFSYDKYDKIIVKAIITKLKIAKLKFIK